MVSSFLTTPIHNNNSNSNNLVLGLIQIHGILISFLLHPDWKMEMLEMREEVLITKGNNYRRLLLAVPLVDRQRQGTGFYPLIR